MPEWLAAGLETPGLPLLMIASLTAGIVYGFAGFGAALIFMPLAATVLPLADAIAAFAVGALASIFTVLPGAWARADRRATLTMLVAAVVAMPFGVWILRTGDATALRWAVSVVVLTTLAAMMAGWRYSRRPGVPAWLGVGGAVGFLGGSVGLNGPAMVLFQLGGPDEVDRTRANTITVLTLSGAAYLPMLAAQGVLSAAALGLGCFLIFPYAGGALIGRRLFDAARARPYRRVAYLVIGLSAVLGLPLWS